MRPLVVSQAAAPGQFDVALHVAPVEAVLSLGGFFHSEQLRRALDAVEGWGEDRRVHRILAVLGHVAEVGGQDFPETLVEGGAAVVVEQSVVVEPLSDGELLARLHGHVVQDQFDGVAPGTAGFRDDAYLDSVGAGVGPTGRVQGYPEGMGFSGRQQQFGFVEERIRHVPGDHTQAIHVVGQEGGVVVQHGHVADAADAGGDAGRGLYFDVHGLRFTGFLAQGDLEAGALAAGDVQLQGTAGASGSGGEVAEQGRGDPRTDGHTVSP